MKDVLSGYKVLKSKQSIREMILAANEIKYFREP